jgi:hypothetical protein
MTGRCVILNVRPKRASIFATLVLAELGASTNGIAEPPGYSMRAKVVQQQYRLLSSQRESTSLTGAIVHTALEVSNGARCKVWQLMVVGVSGSLSRSVVHLGLGDGSPDQRPAGIERSSVKRSTNGTNAKAACLQACANISASGGTQALGTAAYLEVAADARSWRAARVPTGCCS